MRAYRNLLNQLTECAPDRLADLPRAFVLDQAARLLRHDEVYVLEQVDKHVPVVHELAAADLARAAVAALSAGRVDDFCFLYKRLATTARPGDDRVLAAYRVLARRGNVGGIEQIVRLTGVRPVLDEATALRAYDVLVAAGRLGAVDYVRQLSGVPVVFDPGAVRTGVRTLLLAGRYSGLAELVRLSGVAVRLDAAELREALERAFVDGELRELAAACAWLGSVRTVTGFADYLQRLVTSGRFAEIPALFVLCSDAELTALTGEIWDRLLRTSCASAIRFGYERHGDADLLTRHGMSAYRAGVESGDRALVRTACERGGARLVAEDVPPLLDDALEEGDLDWISFASRRLGGLPAVDPDLAQLMLARLGEHCPEQVGAAAEMLGVPVDEPTGRWLARLADGQLAAAAATAAGLPDHRVAAAAYGC